MTSLVRRLEVQIEGETTEGSGPDFISWEKELHDEPHCDHFLIK